MILQSSLVQARASFTQVLFPPSPVSVGHKAAACTVHPRRDVTVRHSPSSTVSPSGAVAQLDEEILGVGLRGLENGEDASLCGTEGVCSCSSLCARTSTCVLAQPHKRCTHTRTHSHTYTTLASTQMHTHSLYVHAQVRVCVHVQPHTHARAYASAHKCMLARTHTHAHTHTLKTTHKHTGTVLNRPAPEGITPNGKRYHIHTFGCQVRVFSLCVLRSCAPHLTHEHLHTHVCAACVCCACTEQMAESVASASAAHTLL